MRLLLSTIGSRGDVQPLVAVALQLRELGQEVRLCRIGTAHPPVSPTSDGGGSPRCLRPEVAARDRFIANAVRTGGAKVAVQRLMTADS